mmetsp:Transcript_4350/g.18506  ORF Transcript_4350/g.18506 Transcript_4350/m.18506 type:complete len:134 (+) Transcript_4350:1154-1555(+)
MTYLWHHCLPNDALVQSQLYKAEINERSANDMPRRSQMQAKLVEFGSWCTLALYIIGSCVALHYCLELDKVVAKFVEDTPSIESLVSTALSPLPPQQIRSCLSRTARSLFSWDLCLQKAKVFCRCRRSYTSPL